MTDRHGLFPIKNSARYTELYGIRIEKELKEDILALKRNSTLNVSEAVRIMLRQLINKLKEQNSPQE